MADIEDKIAETQMALNQAMRSATAMAAKQLREAEAAAAQRRAAASPPDPAPSSGPSADHRGTPPALPEDLQPPDRRPAQHPPGVPSITPPGHGLQAIRAALASGGLKKAKVR